MITTNVIDVVIVGDGPAGTALAQACTRRGVDCLLIGDDADWVNPYGTWVDDLSAVELLDGHDVLGVGPFDVVAWSDKRHDLQRSYGMVDNTVLRNVLRRDVAHHRRRVTAIRRHAAGHTLDVDAGPAVECRVAVDATGWPATFATQVNGAAAPAWQTAFGVVLAKPPDGDLGTPTFMDFRAAPGGPAADGDIVPNGQSSFVYSLPVADGWLIEETVLAARPAVPPSALRARLAARLGMDIDTMLERAVRTEEVRIPMGGARPRRDQSIVAFGAAAGYVNPTSGYSIVHAMNMATPVAAAIAASVVSPGPVDPLPLWNAVWPVAHRRTRTLHDYGLDMLTRLDAEATRRFFGEFFDLPADTWPKYMRPETPPTELSAVMATLFKQASWSTRRRLVSGNPAAFARLLRPS